MAQRHNKSPEKILLFYASIYSKKSNMKIPNSKIAAYLTMKSHNLSCHHLKMSLIYAYACLSESMSHVCGCQWRSDS